MKKHILFLGVLCFQIATTKALGQQNSSISSWISAHPSVHIFSEKNYENLDQEFKSKLKGNIVIYHDKLTLDLLLAYDPMEKSEEVSSITYSRDDSNAQVIKEWLALNRDVKIIKQSEFQLMTEERKQFYQSMEVMVLSGEVITIEDIINYLH